MNNLSQKTTSETARDLIYSAAKEFIDQHYGNQDPSPEVIFSELKHSSSTLDRAFPENKTSVMSFILKMRVNVARQLIENHHHYRIETIAYQCGFSTPSVFLKAFKT